MKIITDTYIQKLQNKKRYLLYFWSAWCGVCAENKEFEQLNIKDIEIGFVNMDENPHLSTKYEIIVAPTYLLLEFGKIKKKHIGKKNLKQLHNFIDL
jgi:thioredoxin-like negative regulator of GroEL